MFLAGSLRIGPLDCAMWHGEVNLGQKCFELALFYDKPIKIHCQILVIIFFNSFPVCFFSLINNEGYVPVSDAHRIVQSKAPNKPLNE